MRIGVLYLVTLAALVGLLVWAGSVLVTVPKPF
jgi:hypothetical protein